MPRKRLIDRIPVAADVMGLPPQWTFLMEPFILSLDLPPEMVAELAYSDVEAGSAQWYYLRYKMHAILRLGTTSQDIEHNVDVLMADDLASQPAAAGAVFRRPTLIVGDPGIGKTTWITRFFSQEVVERRFYYYRFDGLIFMDAFEAMGVETFIRSRVRDGLAASIRHASKSHSIDTDIANTTDTDLAQLSDAETAGLLRNGIAQLAEHGLTGWIILDNLDRRPRAFQEFAIEYAKALSQAGLRVLVAARPPTVRDIRSMDDMICVTVPPPSLADVMDKRVEVAMAHPLCKRIMGLILGGISVKLPWTDEIADRSSLESLYEKVALCLGNCTTLYEHLHHIHCGDLHEMLRDLRELLSTGSFCAEVIMRLAGDQRDERVFLTAYLRGKYRHHRGIALSGERVVNIYDTPTANRANRFLCIRILQFVRRLSRGAGTVSFAELRDRLLELDYDPHLVQKSVAYLIHRRLIVEVRRMCDWASSDVDVAETDQLALSISGDYYLDKLIATTRYVVAMADNTDINTSTVDDLMSTGTTAEDAYRNGYYLLEEVEQDLSDELDRIGEDRFASFFETIEFSNGFFGPAVAACREHVRILERRKEVTHEVARLWDSLQSKADKINELKSRFVR